MYKYEDEEYYQEQKEIEANSIYVNEVLRGSFHQLPAAIGSLQGYLKFIGTADFRVFECLKNTVVRARKKYDPMDIYDNYYLKGKLACSWSDRELSDFLSMDRKSIYRCVKSLESKEYIKKETAINKKNNNKQNVYIVGDITITGIGNIESIYCYRLLWDTEAKIIYNKLAQDNEKLS